MSEAENTIIRNLNQDEYERQKRKLAKKKAREEKNKERYTKGLSMLKSDDEDEENDPKPAPARALLKARDKRMNLEASVGKTQVVQGFGNEQPGFYCKVCDVTLKDNLSYIDHCNGKKHLSELGISLRVETSTLEQVKAKLAEMKRKRDAPKNYDLDERIALAIKKEEEEKEARKLKKKEKKEAIKKKKVTTEQPVDEEMLKIMGFGGFDTTKKS